MAAECFVWSAELARGDVVGVFGESDPGGGGVDWVGGALGHGAVGAVDDRGLRVLGVLLGLEDVSGRASLRFEVVDLLPCLAELPFEPGFDSAVFGEALDRRQIVHTFDSMAGRASLPCCGTLRASRTRGGGGKSIILRCITCQFIHNGVLDDVLDFKGSPAPGHAAYPAAPTAGTSPRSTTSWSVLVHLAQGGPLGDGGGQTQSNPPASPSVSAPSGEANGGGTNGSGGANGGSNAGLFGGSTG